MSPNETEELIQKLLDSEISEIEFVRLEEELSLNPEARQVYRDHVYIQSALDQGVEFQSGLDSKRLMKRRRRFPVRQVAGIAAVLAVMGFLFLFLNQTSHEEAGHLVFEVSSDSRYVITAPESDGLGGDNTLPPGALFSLSQGTVKLEFATGVRSIVSAPASFTLASRNKLNLHEGKAWFKVPEAGKGFQVETSGMLMTDYGTEFGLIHIPGSTDELHVLRGEVKAKSLTGPKAERFLKGGDSCQVDDRGVLIPAPRLNSPFMEELPEKLPYLHFPFEEVHGNQVIVQGEHPFLDSMMAKLVQSDDRPGTTRLVEGRLGTGLSFDGLGDLLKTNWPGVYGTQPLTISFWMKPSRNPNYAGIVSWGIPKSRSQANRSDQWKVVLRPGVDRLSRYTFKCAWGHQTHIGVPTDVPPEEWSHFVLVYTGKDDQEPARLHFYVNGEEQVLKRRKFPDPPSRPNDLADAVPLMFGHPTDWEEDDPRHQKNFLKGVLDEVFLIEGALTAEQVQRLYIENEYSR